MKQEEEEMKLRAKYKREGKTVLDKEDSEVEDSNVITPGTFFMYKLSEKLQSYIQERICENPGWKNIKVYSLSSKTLNLHSLMFGLHNVVV